MDVLQYMDTKKNTSAAWCFGNVQIYCLLILGDISISKSKLRLSCSIGPISAYHLIGTLKNKLHSMKKFVNNLLLLRTKVMNKVCITIMRFSVEVLNCQLEKERKRNLCQSSTMLH